MVIFRNILFSLAALVLFPAAHSQDSRNGYWLPVRDTIRIFLIYAEVANDPHDPGNLYGWEPGKLPPDPWWIFDHQLTPGKEPRGRVTKYFHEASFGQYVVLADHYPEMVSIDYDQMRGNGFENVMDHILSNTGDDIITANGYSVNNGDFDMLSTAGHYGENKPHEPDSMIDMLMLMWRYNSKWTRATSAGHCVPGIHRRKIKAMKGTNSHSIFVNTNPASYIIIRHEFSHLLLGGNNFHTGGSGAGTKTFMSSAGGYAMLSSWDRYSEVYSGFDRRRLGWRHPDNLHQISARDPLTGEEVPADLVYGQDFAHGSNEFVLRDFVSTGDAIRIELPYLKAKFNEVNRQWLWLENHQKVANRLDHSRTFKKGVTAYIQVNKETLSGRSTFGGNGNYTWPLSAFGNYDYRIDEDSETASITDAQQNPFTGYNNLIFGAYDLKDRDGLILRDELFMIKNLKVNGEFLDSSVYRLPTYPLFGSSLDAFLEGDRIAIDENPAPVPLLTYFTSSSGRAPPRAPMGYDNRSIPLNGICVEFLEQRPDGSIRLRIRWNERNIRRDVRWCGEIHLYEELNLEKRCRILLDLGLTPRKPREPIDFKEKKVFSDPSSLNLEPGSRLRMRRRSTLVVDNLSTLLLGRGSKLVMDPRSRIIIKNSGTLKAQAGSSILGRGKIILEEGARIQIDKDAESEVRIRE